MPDINRLSMKELFIISALCLAVTSTVLGQSPPPNDNFANRIQFTGSSVTFTGTLAGSTVEPGESTCVPYGDCLNATNSVWWTWTATESTPVHIVALAYSQDTYVPSTYIGNRAVAGLSVYWGTHVFGTIPTNSTLLDQGRDKISLSFQAVAGTTYQIQFFSLLPTLSVTFQLFATNPPVILENPKDQTIFTNGSAFFSILATSLSPLSYQWQCNGTNVPGANDPMLAVDLATTNSAGDYSVIVSNATGVSTSAPARLNVTATALRPLLGATGPADGRSFAFNLKGESGRYYRIESSSDLVNWNPENSFPSRSPVITGVTTYGSVIFAPGSNCVLNLPLGTGAKFFRASIYTPVNEICNNHLKQIRLAKDLWMRDTNQSWNANPTEGDLLPYCAHLDSLSCPLVGGTLGSSYTLNDVIVDPNCKVLPSHSLEEPR